MNSKYKLQIKLTQHTPLLHFQGNEVGANLRATEVKPKLDKFLLDKIGDKLDDKWYIDKPQHHALNYKMKFKANGNKNNGTVSIMPNTDEDWISHDSISMNIFSEFPKLIALLKENLNEFFVLHNFGKRQSKGFGCFYPDDLDEDTFKKAFNSKKHLYKYSKNHLRINNSNTDFYSEIILKRWGELKSGKNHNVYIKSAVFSYLCNRDLKWDKRWIKKKIKEKINDNTFSEELLQTREPINSKNQNSWEEINNNPYVFGRALLGLAELYEFRIDGGGKYQVKISSDEIERYKSPITFKVFNNSVYAFLDKEEEIYNKKFTMTIIQNKISFEIPDKLRTPTKEEFNMIDFMAGYFPTIQFTKI